MDTSISISPELRAQVEQEAHARGMTVADFVHKSLEWVISHKRADDPLFADRAVYEDDGPDDMAASHDDYLYGDAS